MGGPDIVIDHINNLRLSKEEAGKHFNELKSLQYLAQGLFFLNDQVLKIETHINETTPGNKRIFSFGNSPSMKGTPQELVACAFHWYAVTVCNYVKMVGWLATNGSSDKAREYMQNVLPQVHLWRHKVAAHFAIIDPHRDDNAADLASSVIFPISYDDDAFYVGSLILSKTSGGHQSTSRLDMRWSLTHTHSNLVNRYWPPK